MVERKTLILHVAVPDVNIDDWDELVEMEQELRGNEPTAKQMGSVLITESIREEVGITLVTIPGEKSMKHEFDVFSFNGRIVGAAVGEVGDEPRLVIGLALDEDGDPMLVSSVGDYSWLPVDDGGGGYEIPIPCSAVEAVDDDIPT